MNKTEETFFFVTDFECPSDGSISCSHSKVPSCVCHLQLKTFLTSIIQDHHRVSIGPWINYVYLDVTGILYFDYCILKVCLLTEVLDNLLLTCKQGIPRWHAGSDRCSAPESHE